MDKTKLEQLLSKIPLLKAEIAKKIIGQEAVIDQILVALLAGGHALLEGVPGLAKTLMVRSLSEGVDLNFKRIQFTPDLMPSDIVGTEILQQDTQSGNRAFQFVKGPIFSNIILADEINRTPPKTQAALLEAMQEKSVTYAGKTYELELPFFILATQNPIEQAGTFPLPEAQLDRFMLYIKVAYPSAQEEIDILSATTGKNNAAIESVMKKTDIIALQNLVREVSISKDLIAYVSQLVRVSRPQDGKSTVIKDWVDWGAGPRAGQALILSAKAKALLDQRYAATLEDVQTMAFPVLRHRIVLNFRAEAENKETDEIIAALLKEVKSSSTSL